MTPLFNRWGTIAFQPDFMARTIGVGEPKYDRSGEFIGFAPTRPILNLHVWLVFVPECYRDAVSAGALEIWPRYENQKADQQTIASFRAELWQWIAANVEPA